METNAQNKQTAVVKKIRSYVWLLSALFKRHRRIIILGFIGGISIVWLGQQLVPNLRSRLLSSARVVAMVGTFTPGNLPLKLQQQLSQGLTRIAPDGQVLPALAVSWVVSEDGREYTFKLRDDVTWHDNSKFTAYDVNYNLKDVQFLPQDETTLVVTLKDKFTPLPSFLAKPLFRKGLIGVGTYKIAKIVLKEDTVDYLQLTPHGTDGPVVEIKFYPTESSAKTAFKLGEVTGLDEIADAHPFDGWRNVTVTETVMYDRYVGVFFNVEDALLKTKEIRQALTFGVEKPERNRLATPLSSQSWAYSDKVKLYEKDLASARKLLGNGENRGEIALSTFHQYLSLAETIAAGWKALGFNVSIKVIDTIPDNFQVLIVSQEIPSDPDQYPLWHSTQTDTNITGYANPKIDKLLEDGRKESDQQLRKKIYYDFQRYLVDDAPAVFLFHPTTYTVNRK